LPLPTTNVQPTHLNALDAAVSLRSPRRTLMRAVAFVPFAALLFCTGHFFPVHAFAFIGNPPYTWPNGNVPMVLELGAAGRTLIDGNTSWDAVAQQALTIWNGYLGTIQFAPTTQSPGVGSDGDHVNQAFYNSTIYGQAFGSGVLAVTTGWHNGTTRTEADVTFNTAIAWDSYRGALRFANGELLCDFRRVALHEFGHVLGLDHPDQAGQTVSAIMNSMISDLDTLAADDINGAETLYPPQLPTITAQPQSQSVAVGSTVTFSVSAIGSPPLSYQWRFNGVNIPLQTGPSYTISNAQTTHSANYTVLVSNGAGSVPSATAVLKVGYPPSITTQPQSRTVTAGNSVSFSVAATGTAPLAYQWQQNGADISGATSSTYSIGAVQASDAAYYTVSISSPFGSQTSAAATLTVLVPPTITTQPQSLTVNIGASAMFTAAATGNPAPTYQWKFNGANIGGATASTYTRSNVQPVDAGSYTVVVNNSGGTTNSQPATLTINKPPAVSVAVSTNGTPFTAPATILVSASASDTDGTVAQVDFYEGTNLLGTATTTPFTFTWNSVPAGSYTLTARATDDLGGTATSAPASVTVNPPTECFSAPNGLVAWWPGDGTAYDIVGKKNWTVMGGTTFVAGKVGQAFSFNGTDGYVVRANDVATTAVDNWAMAAWVFWKGNVGTPGKQIQMLLYNGNGGANGYGILVPEPGACPGGLCPEVGKLVVLYGGVSYIPLGVALDQNAWNHLALVRENGILKLYKNGTLVFSNATANPNPPSATDGSISVGGATVNNFNGLLDEVMFFGNAISGDEARSLFAADSFGACKPLVFTGITATSDGAALLNLSGQAGKNLTIYGSPDLLNWLPVVTVPNPTGTLQFTNAAGGFNSRFFKATAQ
jgi:hypothetical protein